MKKEIPDFLIEMSKQMNEQPNRCTAHPFWQVRCKREVTCAEGREDFWVIVDTGNDYEEIYSSETCNTEEFVLYMIEHYHGWVVDWQDDNDCPFNASNFEVENEIHRLPDGYNELEKIPMQRIEQVVTTHMTQADAEWFIKRKQHDYPPLYTYVESAYWSPQLRDLQDWIISLTKTAP